MIHIKPRPLSWKLNRTEEERSKRRFEKEKSNVNQEPLYFTVVPGKPKIDKPRKRQQRVHFPSLSQKTKQKLRKKKENTAHIRPRPLSWKLNRAGEKRSKRRFEKEKSSINQEHTLLHS